MEKLDVQIWVFFSLSVLSKTVEIENFSWIFISYSEIRAKRMLHLKTKLTFCSKAYLSRLNIKQNAKDLSVFIFIFFWHLWCSKNLIQSYHRPNSNPVLGEKSQVRSKGNQTMKFGQLRKYDARNFFLQKNMQKTR